MLAAGSFGRSELVGGPRDRLRLPPSPWALLATETDASRRSWLSRYGIRVNVVHPTGVNTPMVINDSLPEFFQHRPRGSA